MTGLPTGTSGWGLQLNTYLQERIESSYVNVKAYGAVGDGIADDTTAIQNAMNAAITAGVPLFVPKGTYLCLTSGTGTTSLGGTLSGLTVWGNGGRQTIFKVNVGNTGATKLFDLASDTNVTFMHVGFDGSNSTTCLRGIQTNTNGTTKNLTVKFCYFTSWVPNTIASIGTTSAAMWLWSADGLDILYNEIVDCGRGIILDDPTSGRCNVIGNRITNTALDISQSGIYVKRASPNLVDDTRIVIRDNYVQGCQRDPTDVSPFTGNGAEGHGIVVLRSKGVRVVGNTCVENGRGILCSYGSWDTVIQQNNCYRNTDSGIRCEPAVTDTDVTVGTAGISRGLIIANNVSRDNGGNQHLGYYGKGIEVSYGAGAIVTGNICYGNQHAGINCDSSSIILIANECYNNWKGTFNPGSNATDQKGGIRIAGSTSGTADCVLIGNVCYDNQTVKTQQYGVSLNGFNHQMIGNQLAGNAISEVYNIGSIKQGFYGAPGTTKPTVTGAKGGNAALTSLITALSNLGLITDSTT